MNKWIHVAVGVIHDNHGRVLLAQRAASAHQGGLWEFPGGKVEAGESVQDALSRELQEEIGIVATNFSPLIKIRHDYGDKAVLLDVWELWDFHGEPHGKEGQPLSWLDIAKLSCDANDQYPLPAANHAIVKALQLPSFMVITGVFADLTDFKAKLAAALAKPFSKCIQLRFPPAGIAENQLMHWLDIAIDQCAQANVQLQINSRILSSAESKEIFSRFSERVGLHLTAADLMADSIDINRKYFLVGASCHNEAELKMAQARGVDFVVISPVLKTTSHPDISPLGWERFAKLTDATNLPVYALGGLSISDFDTVREHAGQGVAGISDFWSD